jgi:hypothetical protein
MRVLRRHRAGADASELVGHAAQYSGGSRIAAVVSALALVFSAYSLWETSLKQAELASYVTGVVTYERDRTAALSIQPDGGFEVLAVPITIANGGARDGPVLGLQLDVKNLKTGLSARFEATYAVDGTYFAAKGDKRPKTPFSALVVAGRSAWTGTVLFYPVSYSNNDKSLTPISELRGLHDQLRKKYADEMGGSSDITKLREKRPDLPEWGELDACYAKVLSGKDKVEVTLKLMSPQRSGWLDRMLSASVPPITLTFEMPDISQPTLLNGEIVRLRRLSPAT